MGPCAGFAQLHGGTPAKWPTPVLDPFPAITFPTFSDGMLEPGSLQVLSTELSQGLHPLCL